MSRAAGRVDAQMSNMKGGGGIDSAQDPKPCWSTSAEALSAES